MVKKIKIGDTVYEKRIICDADILLFAKISGDMNPIHMDEEFAKKSIFKKRIAHGFLVASNISALLASKLPGPGTIYLSQDIFFKKPVFIGDVITTTVSVEEIMSNNIFKMKTICHNQNGLIVINGYAFVKNTEILS